MRKIALIALAAGAIALGTTYCTKSARAQQTTTAGVTNNIDVGAYAFGGGGGGNGGGFAGGYAVRSAPPINNQVVAGNCIQAVGVAASVMGGGGAISWAAEDDECTRRMNAQVLFALGRGDAAYMLMRQNAAVRRAIDEADAARMTGTMPAVRMGPAPNAALAPSGAVQSGPALLPAAGAAQRQSVRVVPDWCHTRDRDVLRRPECQRG